MHAQDHSVFGIILIFLLTEYQAGFQLLRLKLDMVLIIMLLSGHQTEYYNLILTATPVSDNRSSSKTVDIPLNMTELLDKE